MAEKTQGGVDAAAGIPLPEDRLRAEFHAQTARISWHNLQTHYARGAVVLVAAELNLVEVAVQLQQDNKTLFEHWIAAGQVAAVTDVQGQQFFDANSDFWAVVAPPWVLVQLVS
jgi:hypothetical protein